MARYDKYSGVVGGFRVPLNAAVTATSGASSTNQVGVPIAVGVNTSGRALVGDPSNSGFVGVVVCDKAKAIFDVIDVMTAGEIVEVAGLAAGTTYYANPTTGVLTASAPAAGVGGFRVGHTVEATRLVVRVGRVQTND